MKTIISKLTSLPVVFFLIILIIAMVFVQLILSNQLAGLSGRLSAVLTEIDKVERENRDLQVKIHQLGAISDLKQKAVSFGFSEPAKFLFVKQNFLVAEDRQLEVSH